MSESSTFLLRRHLRFLAAEGAALWREPYFSDSRFKKISRYWMRVGQNYLESVGYHMFKPDCVSTDKVDYRINRQPEEAVECLQKYGVAMLPDADMEKINFLTINTCNKLSAASHIVDYAAALKFCEEAGFHKIAKDYFGVNKCQFYTRAWRLNAHPENPVAIGNSSWHRDRDGFKVLKFFVYLTDVGKDDGEHEYAPGTHRIKPLRFVPQVRYSDDEIEERYKTIKLTGGRGTCFAEDTTALHKASMPLHSNRDMVAFAYFTGPVYWDNGTKKIQL